MASSCASGPGRVAYGLGKVRASASALYTVLSTSSGAFEATCRSTSCRCPSVGARCVGYAHNRLTSSGGALFLQLLRT